MRIPALVFILLIFHFVSFGQLEDNTVTVTSIHPIAFQPDQVTFSVYVDFELTAGLADVLTAVQSVGLTEANLVGVSASSIGPPSPTTRWSFVLPVPFSKQGDTLSALTALQLSIGQNPIRDLGYSIHGTQVSPQLQATGTCPYGALFQDALTQARTLASAAGLTLGAVAAVSDGTSFTASTAPAAATSVAGDFAPNEGSLINVLLTAPRSLQSPQNICVMTVRFRLLH